MIKKPNKKNRRPKRSAQEVKAKQAARAKADSQSRLAAASTRRKEEALMSRRAANRRPTAGRDIPLPPSK